ncbi:MAG: D-aminoacyl-tRNA deacylase [Candidatus Thorarchaeota archaeon]
MRVFVTSERDPASLSIKDVLVSDYGFEETGAVFDGNPILSNGTGIQLITSSRDMVDTNHLEEQIKADVYIFCSRHRAESGKPALLVHSTGNLGSEAIFGGNPHEVSIACASLVAIALRALYREREDRNLHEFDVTMEATHHGPTSMNTPLLFIELGSSEEYWRHSEASKAVAAAAMECSKAEFQSECLVGFGGTHYVSKFNKLVLEKDSLIGHIAPKYALTDIPKNVIKQMFSRCVEKAKQAVIDWKGTNQDQREHLIPILENIGVEIVRARDI